MVKSSLLLKIQKQCRQLDVEFINLRVLDLKGKIHSLVLPAKMLNSELMINGIGFDASSYGFAKPEKSDMVMIPDLKTMFIDPFAEKKTAVFMANIHLTDSKRTRFIQDARYVAEKAEKYLRKSTIADRAMFAPEFEFFIFRKAEWGVAENGCFYFIEKESDEQRNFYHSATPDDPFVDFKNEACAILETIGIEIKYHHHEVAVNQHEIETHFNTLLKTADHAVIIKYVLFNLARKHDIHVTFMPKPFYGKAGNGWHVHQFLLKGKENTFYAKGQYGDFSRAGVGYISGMLLHSSSLAAFTNPSTNSYKRLVRGYEAPVAAIFARSNRNAAIRIPGYVTPAETRLEYRPGDAAANPYLSLAAMLMAGIDGINKNLDPKSYYFGPFDSGIPDSKALKKKIRMLPDHLGESLDALEKDNEFLKQGKVFEDDLLKRWIEIKRMEMDAVRYIPHPKEFEQYFDF